MRMEVIREQRTIRLWTSRKHAYVLSFKHSNSQTFQKWWVCVSEEWWRKPEYVDRYTITSSYGLRAIEFARVIWAR